jgi:hypothetical protein
MLRNLAGIVASLALLSCAGPAAETGSDAPPAKAAVVDLTLGAVEGGGPEVFGRIGGLIGDAQGRIFVIDVQASEVRVFDSAGGHLFTFGREGAGPGEMTQPCCIAWGPDGLLWVRDGSNHRYSAFRVTDAGADFVTSREMAHSDVNFLASLTFADDGALVDVGHRFDETVQNVQLVRHHLGADGSVLRTEPAPTPEPTEIGRYAVTKSTADGPATFFFHQPFGPRQLVAHGPGRWAYAISSRYDVALLTGEAPIHLRDAVQGPTLSASEAERGREALEQQVRRGGLRPGELPFDLPERRTPLRAMYFDEAGSLWVELNTPDGSPQRADVWSPEGERVAQIEWPDGIELDIPGWVGDGWALGVQRDELGVEYVARLSF